MNELSQYILNKAIEADICQEWAVKIARATSRGQLLQLYVKGIDFCLSKNFPANEDLDRLGGDALLNHGIHINKKIDGNGEPFTVLLGQSVARLKYAGFTASQLYVKHGCSAEITVTDHAFVVIDCFDDAVLSVDASGQAKVLINVYGNARVTTAHTAGTHVKIIHKQKSTY